MGLIWQRVQPRLPDAVELTQPRATEEDVAAIIEQIESNIVGAI